MRYTFSIANGPEVIVKITDKKALQLVADEGQHNGVMQRWYYDHCDPKPTAAWLVNITEPEFLSPLPGLDEDSPVELFAWNNAADGPTVYATLIEYADDTVELILPDHDVDGTSGAPTDMDVLRGMVIETRLSHSFGDGMERDYAIAGGVDLGMNVNEMSREQLEAELDGETPVQTPTNEQWEIGASILGDEVQAWMSCERSDADLVAMQARISALQAILAYCRGAR